jgi:hypothetical protein
MASEKREPCLCQLNQKLGKEKICVWQIVCSTLLLSIKANFYSRGNPCSAKILKEKNRGLITGMQTLIHLGDSTEGGD